jgi:hypothetical protein
MNELQGLIDQVCEGMFGLQGEYIRALAFEHGWNIVETTPYTWERKTMWIQLRGDGAPIVHIIYPDNEHVVVYAPDQDIARPGKWLQFLIHQLGTILQEGNAAYERRLLSDRRAEAEAERLKTAPIDDDVIDFKGKKRLVILSRDKK